MAPANTSNEGGFGSSMSSIYREAARTSYHQRLVQLLRNAMVFWKEKNTESNVSKLHSPYISVVKANMEYLHVSAKCNFPIDVM